jgi:hypothetical protein
MRIVYQGNDHVQHSIHNEASSEKFCVHLHLQEVHYNLLVKSTEVNDYVLVAYDGEFYPGRVLRVDKDIGDVQVSVLRKFGVNWVWPQHRNINCYPDSAVLRRIVAPVEVGRRGQLSFPFLNI